jgi:tetratricopeptide (TPR) repeat protein
VAATPFTDDPTHQLRELVRAGRFREALDWYRRAEGDLTARPDAQLLAATAATRLGDFAVAAALAGEALQRFTARADVDGRMRTLNLLGVIGFERGRLADAEEHLSEALNLAYRLGDSLAAGACNNSCGVHRWPSDEAAGSPRRPEPLLGGAALPRSYHNLASPSGSSELMKRRRRCTSYAARRACGEPG